LPLETTNGFADTFTGLAKILFSELAYINKGVISLLNTFQDPESSGLKGKREALSSVCELQSKCEQLGVEIRDRFAASEAYGNVVLRRLERMKGVPLSGSKNLESFVKKRLEPGIGGFIHCRAVVCLTFVSFLSALRSYKSAGKRLDETTEAVSRANSLLRTQVDIDNQAMNQIFVFLGAILSISSTGLTILQFFQSFGEAAQQLNN